MGTTEEREGPLYDRLRDERERQVMFIRYLQEESYSLRVNVQSLRNEITKMSDSQQARFQPFLLALEGNVTQFDRLGQTAPIPEPVSIAALERSLPMSSLRHGTWEEPAKSPASPEVAESPSVAPAEETPAEAATSDTTA